MVRPFLVYALGASIREVSASLTVTVFHSRLFQVILRWYSASLFFSVLLLPISVGFLSVFSVVFNGSYYFYVIEIHFVSGVAHVFYHRCLIEEELLFAELQNGL